MLFREFASLGCTAVTLDWPEQLRPLTLTESHPGACLHLSHQIGLIRSSCWAALHPGASGNKPPLTAVTAMRSSGGSFGSGMPQSLALTYGWLPPALAAVAAQGSC